MARLIGLALLALVWSCGTGRSPRHTRLPQLQLGKPHALDLSHLSYPVERLAVFSTAGPVQRSANDTYTFTPQEPGPVVIKVLYQGQQVEVFRFWVSAVPQP